MSTDELNADMDELVWEVPNRLAVITMIAVLGFVQLEAITAAGIPASFNHGSVNRAYQAIGLLFIVYMSIPGVRFYFKYRGTTEARYVGGVCAVVAAAYLGVTTLL